MAGEATKEDTLEAILIAPDGEEFKVISMSYVNSIGFSPATISASVFATSRLRKFFEFDGSFVPVAAGKFTRTIIPEAKVGSSFSSVGWKFNIKPINEDDFSIEKLILTEASVERFSVAESSQGPIIPDVGEARDEVISLSFADLRILFKEMGHVSGKRNFQSTENEKLAVAISFKGEEIEINAPNIEFNTKEKIIEAGEPEKVTIKVGDISGTFQSVSLNGLSLFTARELIEEITDRTALLTKWDDGSLFGPPEVKTALEKIFPLNINYKPNGTNPGQALAQVAARTGLIIGLQADGRLTIELDAVPTAFQFSESGIIGRQLLFNVEEKGSRVTPRAPKIRFYPKRVIKEIVTTDFILAAKQPSGKVGSLSEVGAGLDFNENIEEVLYSITTKQEIDHVGDRDPKEIAQSDNAPSGDSQEIKERVERIRVFTESIGRVYKYAPTTAQIKVIKEIAKIARAEAISEFNEKAKFQESFPEGSKTLEEAPETKDEDIFFNSEGLLDELLVPPLKVVTKLKEEELKPRFYGDIIFHRYYDFMRHAGAIVDSSFDLSTFPPPLPPQLNIPSNFNQAVYDKLINEVEFFGREIDKKFSPVSSVESFTRDFRAPECPPIQGRTLNRNPSFFVVLLQLFWRLRSQFLLQ